MINHKPHNFKKYFHELSNYPTQAVVRINQKIISKAKQKSLTGNKRLYNAVLHVSNAIYKFIQFLWETMKLILLKHNKIHWDTSLSCFLTEKFGEVQEYEYQVAVILDYRFK